MFHVIVYQSITKLHKYTYAKSVLCIYTQHREIRFTTNVSFSLCYVQNIYRTLLLEPVSKSPYYQLLVIRKVKMKLRTVLFMYILHCFLRGIHLNHKHVYLN